MDKNNEMNIRKRGPYKRQNELTPASTSRSRLKRLRLEQSQVYIYTSFFTKISIGLLYLQM